MYLPLYLPYTSLYLPYISQELFGSPRFVARCVELDAQGEGFALEGRCQLHQWQVTSYLPHISPVSPLYLPYISPRSPLDLP